jgi:hypothetical protein
MINSSGVIPNLLLYVNGFMPNRTIDEVQNCCFVASNGIDVLIILNAYP